MVIFPDLMESYQWCPVRSQKGLTVTEWGGYEMDDAGFLKQDILGIKQLDKFSDILKLIKKNGEEPPNIYEIPTDDKEVFRYFSNGWNGDIFQFGTHGLIDYSKKLKPQKFEDLIAANALYRPGPMENHYHEMYAARRNGNKKSEYLWGTEEITKNTFGLLVYQEQIMQVCQQLGGLTMKEADDVRRAMGKKQVDILEGWKGRVQKGFLNKGCSESEFEHLWEVMLEFAKYSFNRSHSAAYAQTAYIGMYLKVYYPLEFWTTSLYYAGEKDVLRYISEIFQAKNVKILPPDINSSKIEMSSNTESKNIFWGIESIKGIGEETAHQIIKERDDNGKYISFANFLERHTFKGSKVKKQTYEALVAVGAFDLLYGFNGQEEKRNSLIKRYRIHTKKKISNPARDPYTIGSIEKKWWWLLKQKELTGLAFIDYEQIAEGFDIKTPFCSQIDLFKNQPKSVLRSFGGYVVECKLGNTSKGKYARLLIENNYKLYKVILWPESYSLYKTELKNCEKSIIIFTANLQYEKKYTKGNQFTLSADSILKTLR
jgi:DNA polymerase-3 subunit alpha